MINKYPYSDMHELNADWLLSKTAELEGRVKELEDGGSSAVTNLVPSFNGGRKLADFEENGQTDAIYEPIDVLPELANAGYHNSIYRGKFLGTAISDEQYAQIASGAFEDMFIGDYWTIPTTINGVTSNVDYIIAAFDYWWNVGNNFPQGTNKHHIVLVPRTALYDARMNATNTTTGGYIGSEMYTTNLGEARTAIENIFDVHLYAVNRSMQNGVDSNGQSNSFAWITCKVELMNEVMICGCFAWGKTPYDIGTDRNILPLFKHSPEAASIRSGYWTRCSATTAFFSYMSVQGMMNPGNASADLGVRPCFAIY